jgi:hypothetical protein
MEVESMQELNKNKTGLILGAFLGFWHFAWSLLVATGVAQTILDFIYYLHFLNNPFQVSVFDIRTAALLIVITSAVGYVFGWLLAFLWNIFHKKAGLERTKPA